MPHRYCDNHFLRDVAKPVLEADSHAKVQMRKKVRGLRKIEQAVLEAAEVPRRWKTSRPDDPEATVTVIAAAGERASPVVDSAGAVVLDYCTAVRGILNDDQGGPLHPPGLRMAERCMRSASRSNGTWTRKKGVRGRATRPLGRMHQERSGRSRGAARDDPRIRRGDRGGGRDPRTWDRGLHGSQEKFEELIDQFEETEDPIRHHMATVMISFLAGLFVGEERV